MLVDDSWVITFPRRGRGGGKARVLASEAEPEDARVGVPPTGRPTPGAGAAPRPAAVTSEGQTWQESGRRELGHVQAAGPEKRAAAGDVPAEMTPAAVGSYRRSAHEIAGRIARPPAAGPLLASATPRWPALAPRFDAPRPVPAEAALEPLPASVGHWPGGQLAPLSIVPRQAPAAAEPLQGIADSGSVRRIVASRDEGMRGRGSTTVVGGDHASAGAL